MQPGVSAESDLLCVSASMAGASASASWGFCEQSKTHTCDNMNDNRKVDSKYFNASFNDASKE